jgi:hypothetical protein
MPSHSQVFYHIEGWSFPDMSFLKSTSFYIHLPPSLNSHYPNNDRQYQGVPYSFPSWYSLYIPGGHNSLTICRISLGLCFLGPPGNNTITHPLNNLEKGFPTNNKGVCEDYSNVKGGVSEWHLNQ